MSRVKLTEYQAKKLLFQIMDLPYNGVHCTSADLSPIQHLSQGTKYVVKVDQGIKKRMKKGLVKLNVTKDQVSKVLSEFEKKSYDHFIIEEMVLYPENAESYIAVERTREGLLFSFSKKGGINVEDHADLIKKAILPLGYETTKGYHHKKILKSISEELGVDIKIIEGMREFFEKYYVSFMEINPLVVIQPEHIYILDLAVEVDSTAEFLVKGSWKEQDIITDKLISEEEQNVAQLNKKSQAAFSLTLLNTNGSIWVLLSGGGASLTIADEIYNLGFGKELGNYGEYSGNPNAEETYLYTKSVLNLLIKSNQNHLVLIIGGGVANFTDIRITFQGILKALEERKADLKKKHLKIFVRRGGPFQEKGLKMIKDWCHQNDLLGAVKNPTTPLHDIVRMAVKEMK